MFNRQAVQKVQIPPTFLKLPMNFFVASTIQKHRLSALTALNLRPNPLILLGCSNDPATLNLHFLRLYLLA